MLLVVGGVLLVGGGRRLLQLWQARKGLARLAEPDVTPEEIEAVARFGRSGLAELFRLFAEAPLADATRRRRDAPSASSGRRISSSPRRSRRSPGAAMRSTWSARRRYPRALRSPIPITVTYGLPFLTEDGPGIKPANLEWSHRITGARRAALEEYSPWTHRFRPAELLGHPRRFRDQRPAPAGSPDAGPHPRPDRCLADRAASPPLQLRVRPAARGRRAAGACRRAAGRGHRPVGPARQAKTRPVTSRPASWT